MNYFENKSLKALFYINEKGLVRQEKWTQIIGLEGVFDGSNLGRVKSLERLSPYKHSFRRVKEKILTASLDDKGYYRYCLHHNRQYDNFLLHRLIAIHFIPNPENKPEVNHIDGNTKNNDFWNLEWNTPKENIENAFKSGLMSSRKGIKNNGSKLTELQVLEIRELHGKITQAKISDLYGLNISTVYNIIKRKSWNHI